MIEIHDHPKDALVDGAQAITPAELEQIMQQTQAIRLSLKED